MSLRDLVRQLRQQIEALGESIPPEKKKAIYDLLGRIEAEGGSGAEPAATLPPKPAPDGAGTKTANPFAESTSEVNEKLADFVRGLEVSRRVLVVDDDVVAQRGMLEHLAAHNIMADACHLAEEALERLEAEKYAVVVAAAGLPDADGFELLRSAREKQPELEFVMVTGQDDIDTALRALDAGAYDYVPKPFPGLQHVGAKISGALARHDFEVRIGRTIRFLTDTCKRMLEDVDDDRRKQTIEMLQQALSQRGSEAGSRIGVCAPQSMKNQLRQLGYEPVDARGPDELVSVVAAGDVQLALFVETDDSVHAAGVVADIHEKAPDAGVLVVIREKSLADVVNAIGVGVGEYIVRPLESREFLGPRLKRLVSRQTRVTRYRRVLDALSRLQIDLARLVTDGSAGNG